MEQWLNNQTIAEQLDVIDKQFPNMLHMPKDVRDTYLQLSAELIGDVWESRLHDHGSIHSHLLPGEKDGQ